MQHSLLVALTGLAATASAKIIPPQHQEHEDSKRALVTRDAPSPSSVEVATLTAGSSESPMPCVVNFLPDSPAVIISCTLTTPTPQPTVTPAPSLAERDVAHGNYTPPDPGYEFLHLSANIDIDFVKSRCPGCYNKTAGNPGAKGGNYTHSYAVSASGTATGNHSALHPTLETTMTSLSEPTTTSSSEDPETTSEESSTSVPTSSTEAPEISSAAPSRNSSRTSRSTRSFKQPMTLQPSSSSSTETSSTESSSTETSLGVGFLNPTPSGVSSNITIPPNHTLRPDPTITFGDIPRTTTIDPETNESSPSTSSSSSSTSQPSTSSTASSTVATSSASSSSKPRPSRTRPQTTLSTSAQATDVASSSSTAEDPATSESSSAEPTTTEEPVPETNAEESTSETTSSAEPTNSDIMTDEHGFTWSVRVPTKSGQPQFTATIGPASSVAMSSSAAPVYSPKPPQKSPNYIPWECDEHDPGCTLLENKRVKMV